MLPNIIIMNKPILLILGLHAILAYEVLFAVNSGSYTHTMVGTKYFNYTVDSYFQGLASVAETKSIIPESIINQADRQIIKTHRTTAQGYSNFSYRPILADADYYIAVITMVQTEFKNKGQRIFHIKLGDQTVHTVDIVAQAGFGKLLHKWIQLDIRQDIAYLNGTLPALNGFNYKTHQARIVFESVKNKPKVESLMFIKGTDAHQYLKQFLQHEQEKSIKVRQYIAQKYRKQPKLSYRPLLATDIIPNQESQLEMLYNKYLNLRSVGCIICGILTVHFDKISGFLLSKLKNMISKIQNIKKEVSSKRKKD